MKTETLRTFDNYFYANIILTRLQSEGINCYLKDEHTVTIDPLISNAIGGIKLAVDIHDSERACELLEEYHEEYVQSAVCPKCKSSGTIEFYQKPVKGILTSVLSAV